MNNKNVKNLNIKWLPEIKNDLFVFREIPLEERTPEICMAAVKQDGRSLGFISKEDQTFELCAEALQRSGIALEYVNKDILDMHPELYFMAVSSGGGALEYISADIQNKYPELGKIAISKNGHAIAFYKNEITPELCMAAVKKDGLAFFNLKVKNSALLLAAIENDPYVVEELDIEMIKNIIENDLNSPWK